MDYSQSSSEIVVFMVYLGKWSGGGVVSLVDESAMSDAGGLRSDAA